MKKVKEVIVLVYSLTLIIGLLCLISSCGIKKELKDKEESLEAGDISWIENNLSDPIHVKGEKPARYSVLDRMAFYKVPGISVAIVKQGQLSWTKGYGIRNHSDSTRVDKETIFQAASVGKVVSSVGALKLVEQGKVALDVDVNQYLTSWKLPASTFTEKEKVTLRSLLTHTAGITVSGFSGYGSEDYFPTDIEVLNGKGNSAAVVVDYTPGSQYRYSGGGFTLIERIVEDVSGLDFATFMEREVFAPLDMENSTYEQPLPVALHHKASVAFGKDGKMVKGKWHNYPEQAAAGLWTTPADLSKLVIDLHKAYLGEKNHILSPNMVQEMLTRDEFGHGLGPGLAFEGDSLAYLHGGKNKGYTSFLVAYPQLGDGILIMSGSDAADPLIAEIQRAAAEYYAWEYRKPEIVELVNLPEESLNKRVGKYIYRPRDYKLEVILEKGELVLIDPNRKDLRYYLRTLDEKSCIQLSTGTKFEFVTDAEGVVTGLIQDGKFQIDKVK